MKPPNSDFFRDDRMFMMFVIFGTLCVLALFIYVLVNGGGL